MRAGGAARSLLRRELALVAVGLALLAALVYGDHVLSGGFLWDDWENADTTHRGGQPGFLGPFDLRQAAYRPLLALLLPLPHLAFGVHPAPHLALGLLLAVAASAAFFALLRAAGAPRTYATAAAALALLFPWSASTRLWATASVNMVALVLLFAAGAIALRALAGGEPRRRVALTAAMYALAVLTYEAVAGLVLLLPLLYALRAPWRTALARWRVEAVAAGGAAVWVALATTKPERGPGGALGHAADMARDGGALLGRALAPWDAVPPAAAIGAAAALAAAAWSVRRRAARPALLAVGVALAALALGWLPFVPGEAKYVPGAPGIYDRVNIVAGFALAALVVALGALAATLVRSRAGPAVALIVVVATGAGWAAHVRGDVADHARAAAAQEREVTAVTRAVPSPPSRTVFVVFHDSTWAAPGVPVFGQPWDVGPALRFRYRDASLAAFPLAPGSRVACGARALSADAAGAEDPEPVPYGRAILVDVRSGTAARADSARGCREAVAAIRRGRASA